MAEDTTEATGNSIHKLLNEINQPADRENPYRYGDVELEKEIAATKTGVNVLLKKFEQLWLRVHSNYVFSTTARH